MVNKKIVIISSIIAIVVVALIIFIEIKSSKNTKDTYIINERVETNTLNTKNSENAIKQETENTVISDDDNTVNSIVDNTVEENKIDNETTSNETQELSDEDKAKKLAKKQWGENDESVYYYLEEKISDDVYIISVRNRETTISLMDFEVNIKTGVVSEY